MTISADDHLPDPVQPKSPVVSEPPPLPSQVPAQEPAGGLLGQLDRFFVAGKQDRDAAGEAKRVHTLLAKPRPPLPKEEQDMFLDLADTDLQGTQLLDRQLPVGQAILRFIDVRLVKRSNAFPWSERKSPVGMN